MRRVCVVLPLSFVGFHAVLLSGKSDPRENSSNNSREAALCWPVSWVLAGAISVGQAMAQKPPSLLGNDYGQKTPGLNHPGGDSSLLSICPIQP